jgi:hypothetical protein
MEPRNQFQGIDSASLCPGGPVKQPNSNSVHSPLDCSEVQHRAGIFKQSMGTRNRVGIGLLYRLARLHRLAESIPRNRFLGSLNVYKYRLRLHCLAELVSLESIPGLLKRLQIWAQATLASRIGSLELIPGLFKCLQIQAQATLASVNVSLEWIPRLHNMKNEDEDNFFLDRNEYIRPSTIKGTKNNKCICS